jgi:Na+/H+-dicarboxylate symporter
MPSPSRSPLHSSTATMPLTYACLRDTVGLREKSAGLGALVGSNFNKDGTALYEAMAALFVAQMNGVDLPAGQQLMVAHERGRVGGRRWNS